MAARHDRRPGVEAVALTLLCVALLACGDDAPTEPSGGADPPPAGFVQVAAGLSHTCALHESGRIYCWGRNAEGQLGLGAAGAEVVHATPIAGDLNFVGVAAGDHHTCALDVAGAAHCWGANDSGQLGDSTNFPRGAPVPVSGGHTFTALAVGAVHACALVTPTHARCWGDNSFGQLGTAGPASQSYPGGVELILKGEESISLVAIDAGGGHTCGIDINHAVYCWGNNGTGQLGDGTTTSRDVPVAALGGGVFDFESISAGGVHTCAWTAEGGASCWGFNLFGQLGDGTNDDRDRPGDHVRDDPALIELSAGADHTCGLTAAGAAYCSGLNVGGRLGDGTEADRNRPTPVSETLRFTAISAGGLHTCAVATDSDVYCWGTNVDGQLGDGTIEGRLVPVRVVVGR